MCVCVCVCVRVCFCFSGIAARPRRLGAPCCHGCAVKAWRQRSQLDDSQWQRIELDSVTR